MATTFEAAREAISELGLALAIGRDREVRYLGGVLNMTACIASFGSEVIIEFFTRINPIAEEIFMRELEKSRMADQVIKPMEVLLEGIDAPRP